MAELKDFGTVKSWYTAYKQTQLNEKKVEKEDVAVLPDDEDKEKEKKPEPKDKAIADADGLKVENEKLKAEIEKLKLDLKKKDSETNVEPNADTGEVPLRVGIAQSILDKKKKQKQEVKEDGHIDVSSAIRQCKTTIEDASQIMSKLQGMSPEEDLPSWWMNKLAIASNSMNKIRDYLLVPSTNEVTEMKKDDAYAIGMSVAKKKMKDEPPLDKKTIKKGHEIARKILKGEMEESKTVNYARKLSSYAVKRGGIDRNAFMKIANKISTAKNDMDMKKIAKQIDDMDTEPRDLVKGSIALQLGPKTFKKMFGDRLTSSDMNQYKRMTPRSMREENVELDEVNTKDGTMTSKQLDSLKKSYSTVGNTIAPEKGMALAKMLDRFGEGELRQLVRKDIKFVSTLAVNKLIMKHKYKAKDIHDIRKK
jgi:hypothetical protein